MIIGGMNRGLPCSRKMLVSMILGACGTSNTSGTCSCVASDGNGTTRYDMHEFRI
jgi:hypothetical protein